MRALADIRSVVIDSDISSFELIHSGLVRKLLQYLTTSDGGPLPFGSNARDDRLRSFLHVFMGSPVSKHTCENFKLIVHKLQKAKEY